MININLLFSTFAIYFGTAFQFGFNNGSLNPIKKIINKFYMNIIDENSEEWYFPLCLAMGSLGGALGAMSMGFILRKIGRRQLLIGNQLVGIMGGIFQFLTYHSRIIYFLPFGRFVTGIHCGIGSQLGVLYITEIAPLKIRGSLGMINQLMITLGILFASILGLENVFGTDSAWCNIFLMNVASCILCSFCMMFIPESPQYLSINPKDKEKTIAALKFFRRTENIEVELEQIMSKTLRKKNESFFNFFQKRFLLYPLLISLCVQYIQQMCGINFIFFYSYDIFKNLLPLNCINYGILACSIINVMGVVPSIFLVDRIGRRPLMIYSLIGMFFFLISVMITVNQVDRYSQMLSILQQNYTYTRITVMSIFFYIILFELGIGPIPHIITCELFDQNYRSMAMSIAGCTNWIFTLIVSFMVIILKEVMHNYIFIIFIVNVLIFIVVLYFIFPETNQKTFQEISKTFLKPEKTNYEVIDEINV